MLYTLVYVSIATKKMSEDDLIDILTTARRNNILRGITGMLLYRNGQFMQALEGDKQKIEEIFQKIQKDPRHSKILILSRKEITDRLFFNWSMGFENLSGHALQEIEGYSNFIDVAFSDEIFRQSETAYNLLRKFAVAN